MYKIRHHQEALVHRLQKLRDTKLQTTPTPLNIMSEK